MPSGGACAHPGEQGQRQQRRQQRQAQQHRPAPHTVGQRTAQRGDRNHRHRRNRRQPQRVAFVVALRMQERRHVGDAHVVGDRAQRRDREGARHCCGMVAQHMPQRRGGNAALAPLTLELRRLVHARACNQDHQCQRGTEEERNAPAPAVQLRGGQQRDSERGNRHRQQRPHFTGCRRQRGHQASSPHGCAFQQVRHHAGVFTADRKRHHAAQYQQQHACCSTCRGRCRQQGSGQHCRCHQRHRSQQHPAPA